MFSKEMRFDNAKFISQVRQAEINERNIKVNKINVYSRMLNSLEI